MIQLTPVDIIGPIPGDEGGLVVLADGHGIYMVKCGPAEAVSCYLGLSGRLSRSPYSVMVDAMAMAGSKVSSACLLGVEGSIYSAVMIGGPGGVARTVSDDAGFAICTAVATGLPLEASESLIKTLPERHVAYWNLKMQVGRLWPVGLDNSACLRALSDFMDEVEK